MNFAVTGPPRGTPGFAQCPKGSDPGDQTAQNPRFLVERPRMGKDLGAGPADQAPLGEGQRLECPAHPLRRAVGRSDAVQRGVEIDRLYKDGGHAQPWGQGGGLDVSSTGTGADQDYVVYGQVPPQTTPSPGLYQDTVVAGVTY